MTQFRNGLIPFFILFLSCFCCVKLTAQPKIEFTSTIIDMGEVQEGEYKLYWYFKNTGNEPVVIQAAQGSGSILVGEYDKEPVLPGKEGAIIGRLFTKGWAGNSFNKTLVVRSNIGKGVVVIAKGSVISNETAIDQAKEPVVKDQFIRSTGRPAKTVFTNRDSVAATKVAGNYKVHPGDILFQDLDCGEACDAIESVTEGANGMDFSHCGIVAQVGNEMMVIEAYGSVKATPVDSFFARSKNTDGTPKVLVGRVRDEYEEVADKSSVIAKSYIGKGYDEAFDMKNDSYYCSELLYECFKKANDNKVFFPLNKMTFKTPGTDAIMPFWVEYFNKIKIPVPEGKPGINPGAMSRSSKLILLKPEEF